MKHWLLSAVCAAMLFASSGRADAAVLYGTSHFNREGTGTSWLYQIDAITGATTQIGDTGFDINGLNYYNGTLYAIDGRGGSLLSVNTTTGAATAIAALTGVADPGNRPTGLTISSSGAAYTWLEPGTDDLASLNLGTGAFARVGESGLGTAAHGITFVGNTLYLVNFNGATYVVNTVTGAATLIGSIGTMAHHGDINPDNGLYYGLSGTNGSGVMQIANLTTPAYVSTVLLDRAIMHALAFVDGAEIPEPASLTLLSLGSIGLIGFARRRRRTV